MNTKRFTAFAGLVLGLLLAGGCVVSFVTPKTAALHHVHEIYGEEFIEFSAPAPSVQPSQAPEARPGAFARSLQAIHDYRAKYPQDSQELAHLKVLEGMIYLQSGRFGLAEAVRPDVEAAGGKLASGTGRVVRDQLFARTFKELIEGWAETRKSNNRRWQTFERIAGALTNSLSSIPREKLANPEADQGALYLATSAAIFYVWAFKEISESNDREMAPQKKAAWYKSARDWIGRFLTDAEKKEGVDRDLGAAPEGRLRYVEWYHWLGRN
jgi:hypothetical protein